MNNSFTANPQQVVQACGINLDGLQQLNQRPSLPWQRILGQNWLQLYTPMKSNCSLFAPTPYFRHRAIWRCHLNFSSADPCCYGNEFWDKIDYNSASAKDNCTLFSPIPYFRARAIQCCDENSPLKTPVVMATNRFYSKTKLAAGSQQR